MTPTLKVCSGNDFVELIDVRGGTLARFPAAPAASRQALEVFAGSVGNSAVAVATKVLWLLNFVLAKSGKVDVAFINWNHPWPTVSVEHFILGWDWKHLGLDSDEGLDSLTVDLVLQDVPAARQALAAIVEAPLQWTVHGVRLTLGLRCGADRWTLERTPDQHVESTQFWGEWRKQ